MSWTPLPTGCFTGIDWGPADATRGWDPYLVWAECDRFAGYGDRPPRRLPVAIELHATATIAQLDAAGSAFLRIPKAYLTSAPAGLRFCTADVLPAFFQAIQPGGALHAIVKRVEMGLPAVEDDGGSSGKGGAGSAALQAQPPCLHGKVFGLIDDSLAVAHGNFLRDDGSPRTAYLWRQDGRGRGATPSGFRYGHELTAADIATAIDRSVYGGLVDESAVYADLGLSTLGRKWPKGKVQFHALDTSVSHGTHVADLAVGPRTAEAQIANVPPHFDAPPTWAAADDDASRCPIVAVQLDYQTVKDTSGASLNVHVLDGLMYILARCADDAQVAVNLSFGSLAGPHDGTSLLECAMDQLILLYGGRLQITLAAGNSYQLRTHANVPLQPGASQALHWRVQPDDTTQSFLELWFEEGCTEVQVQLTPPGWATPLATSPMGVSGMWADPASGKPLCALIYPSRTATGERGTCALLAVAPTFSFGADVVTAPSGVWKVVLSNGPTRAVVIDAYVERDDVVIGTHGGARQSHLEDTPSLDWYQQYDMQAYVDDPARSTPIRRSGNFNSIATGSGTVSVGGQRVVDATWAFYSPRDPDPDASRPARPDVVKVPDEAACSDESAALTGLKAAGTRSGGVARLQGTSDAAPQVARRLVNG